MLWKINRSCLPLKGSSVGPRFLVGTRVTQQVFLCCVVFFSVSELSLLNWTFCFSLTFIMINKWWIIHHIYRVMKLNFRTCSFAAKEKHEQLRRSKFNWIAILTLHIHISAVRLRRSYWKEIQQLTENVLKMPSLRPRQHILLLYQHTSILPMVKYIIV